MVDNRGISPVTGYFKSGDGSAMANKMSEEKNGQGAEYFASEIYEEEQIPTEEFQDRSAQLRASLNGLAAANVGAIRFMKAVKEKEEKENTKKRKYKSDNEELEEEVFED